MCVPLLIQDILIYLDNKITDLVGTFLLAQQSGVGGDSLVILTKSTSRKLNSNFEVCDHSLTGLPDVVIMNIEAWQVMQSLRDAVVVPCRETRAGRPNYQRISFVTFGVGEGRSLPRHRHIT